jgi:hypothetical protein
MCLHQLGSSPQNALANDLKLLRRLKITIVFLLFIAAISLSQKPTLDLGYYGTHQQNN